MTRIENSLAFCNCKDIHGDVAKCISVARVPTVSIRNRYFVDNIQMTRVFTSFSLTFNVGRILGINTQTERVPTVSVRNRYFVDDVQMARVFTSFSLTFNVGRILGINTQTERVPTVPIRNRYFVDNTQAAQEPVPPIISYAQNVKGMLISAKEGLARSGKIVVSGNETENNRIRVSLLAQNVKKKLTLISRNPDRAGTEQFFRVKRAGREAFPGDVARTGATPPILSYIKNVKKKLNLDGKR